MNRYTYLKQRKPNQWDLYCSGGAYHLIEEVDLHYLYFRHVGNIDTDLEKFKRWTLPDDYQFIVNIGASHFIEKSTGAEFMTGYRADEQNIILYGSGGRQIKHIPIPDFLDLYEQI